MKLAAVVLVLVFPFVAGAEADLAPETPRWSIGAGAGTIIFGNDLLLSGIGSSAGMPFVRASLERRVGERTWLVVGASAFYETTDTDPTSTSYSIVYTETDSTERSGRVEAGLRRELTGARAPFVVSGLLLANVGGLSLERRYLTGTPGQEVQEDSDAFVAGLSAGAAVERELTRGLSVRISSPVVITSWSWREIRTSGQPSRDARTFGVSLTLAPLLELRLVF